MFALRLDVGLPPARHTVGDGAKVLIDAPGVEDEDTKKEDTEIVLTDDNADEVMKIINSFNR